MTNITKAAQDALSDLDWLLSHVSEVSKSLSDRVLINMHARADALRAALQDKAGEVQGEREAFEAFAQNCPMGRYNVDRKGDGYDSSHTQIMWDTWKARAAQPAPVVPDDVARDAEWFRLIRNGSGWPAVFAAHDAPEPLRGDDLDAAMLAASQQKGGQ